MVMTDPIADFLTRIRNANMAKHESLEVPASKSNVTLLKSLRMKDLYVMLNISMMTNKASLEYF